MSWNFKVIGSDRADVFAKLRVAVDQYGRAKPEADRIMKAAEACSAGMPDDAVREIETYGHYNPDGSGYVSMKVTGT
jgi:hypothetical protein